MDTDSPAGLIMARRFLIAVIGLVLSMPPIAAAEESGNESKAARGHEIANKICSPCHVVGENQDFPPILSDPAPDFRVIARRLEVTADSLATFLRTTHRTEGKSYTMPAPLLSDEMINEVASYILSLRK